MEVVNIVSHWSGLCTGLDGQQGSTIGQLQEQQIVAEGILGETPNARQGMACGERNEQHGRLRLLYGYRRRKRTRELSSHTLIGMLSGISLVFFLNPIYIPHESGDKQSLV